MMVTLIIVNVIVGIGIGITQITQIVQLAKILRELRGTTRWR